MSRAPELFEAAAEALGLGLTSGVPIAGGDINQAWRLEFDDGSVAFLKSRAGAPAEEFEMEAAGLEWLGSADALPVPEVLAVISEPQPGLVLEWIEPGGRLDDAGEANLGRGLAQLHKVDAGAFGALPPALGSPSSAGSQSPGASHAREWGLHVGPVSLAAAPEDDEGQGFAGFYAARLEDLAAQAQDRGALDPGGASVIDTLCEHIDEIAGPPEPPSLTHGDLWTGNVFVSSDGRPHLIDPAAHGAHRELDLSMLSLFGSQSSRFFDAYEEFHPLSDDWQERVRLWQIQPLLIHAILFGGSYGSSAVEAARTYL